MFKPAAHQKYEHFTDVMVNDAGVSIQMTELAPADMRLFEYLHPSIPAQLTFAIHVALVDGVQVEDEWIVSYTPWSATSIVLEHPEIDADRFEDEVRSNFAEAFLAWPPGKNALTVRAKKVTFIPAEKSLRECVAYIRKE